MKRLILAMLCVVSSHGMCGDFPSDQAIAKEMENIKRQKINQSDWEKAQEKALICSTKVVAINLMASH